MSKQEEIQGPVESSTETRPSPIPSGFIEGTEEPAAATVASGTGPPAHERSLLRALLGWVHEGARTVVLRAPRWHGLQAHPALVLALVLGALLLGVLLQRLWMLEPARFDWQPLLAGWLLPGATAWICYALRPDAGGTGDARLAPSAVHLLSLLLAQGLFLSAVHGLLWAVLLRTSGGEPDLPLAAQWALWLGFWGWLLAAQAAVLWRGTPRKIPALLAAVLLLVLGLLESAFDPRLTWVEDESAGTQTRAGEKAPARLQLTQALMERQPVLLAQRLEALQPQRPGVVDLYVLTFAPYAHENVFRRESEMVAQVMQQRFDAVGRTLQLVNHAETLEQWPWATALNLQRALQHVARLMDPAEDVLFIHLTSHGARQGELAAGFWPMSVEGVRPQQLKGWLDEAGIRHRVISVSACYSGSWIDAFSDAGTLIMTAADAQHTSYGCGTLSELTFFGRAMYDEQLRSRTRSFAEAHAAARLVIQQREREAGKDDGYSNPQLRIGSTVQAPLERLRRRLEAAS